MSDEVYATTDQAAILDDDEMALQFGDAGALLEQPWLRGFMYDRFADLDEQGTE